MKISFNKKNVVKLFNMKNRLLSIITLVSLTSGMAILGGCTQEEIDAAIAAANNIANEQNQNPGQEVQEPEVTVDPEVEPEVEPEIEPEVEPEEINPRDMKQVHGLDYDVPIYTDEEVAEARENLMNNYKDIDPEEGLTKEQRKEMAKDYYIANQDTIYQINDIFTDFDIKKCQNSFKSEQLEAIYYDEANDYYIVIHNHDDGIIIYGKNFIFTKYSSNVIKEVIGETCDKRAYNIVVGPDARISVDADFSKEMYEEYAEKYQNDNCNRNYEELKEFGLKEQIIENPIITIFDNEQQLTLK